MGNLIELGFSVTIHLLAGDWQDNHPYMRYVNDDFTVGAYLNSEDNLSLYVSHTWDYDRWFAEVGAVTGYSGAPLIPMVRGGYNLSDNTSVFISPAMAASGDVGVVFGMELMVGGIRW